MDALAVLSEADAIAALPEAPTRAEMEAFAAFLVSLEPVHGSIDISTGHHHSDRLYGRSAVIPAGTYLCGLPHKQGALNVCVGDITVWTEQGRRRLTGAHILPSPVGCMRIGYAHADTTWLTVHANLTGTNDVTVIEDALVEHAERLMTRRVASNALLGP